MQAVERAVFPLGIDCVIGMEQGSCFEDKVVIGIVAVGFFEKLSVLWRKFFQERGAVVGVKSFSGDSSQGVDSCLLVKAIIIMDESFMA